MVTEFRGLRPALRQDSIHHHVSGFASKDLGRFRGVAPAEIANWAYLAKTHPNPHSDSDFYDLPTPWSWPLQFEIQLYDPLHVRHAESVAAWRGVMAALVLHARLGLPLQAQALSFSSTSEHPWLVWLAELLPQRSLHPDSNWSVLYTFNTAEGCLGISSPSTLFCPPSDSVPAYPGLAWRTPEGHWGDPVEALSETDGLLLLTWLLSLHDHLLTLLGKLYQRPYAVYTLSLENLLSAFISDLAQKLAQHELIQPLPAGSEAGALAAQSPWRQALKSHLPTLRPSDFQLRGIWASLAQLPFLEAVSESECPLRLLPSPGREPAQQLLILDPAMGKDPKQASQRVIGEYTLHEILALQADEADPHWFGKQFLQSATWCWAESLWLDTLTFFPGLDSLPGCRQDIWGFYNLEVDHTPLLPLIPLHAKLLAYLSAEDLAERLSFEQGEASVRVALRLSLANGQDHVLHKEYPLHAENILHHIPVCKIWPARSSPLIRQYYTYTCGFGQQAHSARLRPLLRAELQSGSAYSVSREKRAADSPDVDMEICRLAHFPEAMLCASPEGQALGLLLLDPPQALSVRQREAHMAIDLGTTNTNVMMSCAQEIRPIQLNGQLLHSVTASIFESDLYEDFLASENVDFPFLTLYKLNHLEHSPAFQAMLDGHIYYVETIHTFASNQRLKTDLKWGTQDKRVHLLAFVQQLCMQLTLAALEHGAEKVRFSFAYPLAFSAFDFKAFEVSVKRALKDLHQHFSAAVDTRAAFHAEGVAAAYYFARGQKNLPPARFHQGVVILDIGGGTTDITVIEGKNNELRFTSSIKFAGRDIFMRAILAHLSLLPTLGVPAHLVSHLRQEAEQGGWDAPQLVATVDALIHEYEQTLFEQLAFKFAMPEVLSFLCHLSLGVAGVFFHLGQIIHFLHQEGLYDRQDALPMFFVAGNGAKVFRWFHRASAPEHNPYLALFRSAFLLFGDSFLQRVKTPLELAFSSTPSLSKPEVVQGMLVDKGLLHFEGLALQAQFLSGESFGLITGEKQTALTPVQRELLLTLDPASLSLDNSQRFFRAYQDWLKGFYPTAHLNAEAQGKVFKRVKNRLQQQIRESQAQISENPDYLETIRDEHILFIQSLKGLYRENERQGQTR